MTFHYKNVYWLWLSGAVMFADQVSKQLVIRSIERFDSVPVAPMFNFVHLQNTGAAFSMLSELPPWVFVLLGVAVAIGILVWLRRNPHGQRCVASGLALILGGALGNVIDRVRLGHVTDFIDFFVGNWHFAAFNVADAAISVGAGLLILDMLLEMRRARVPRAPSPPTPSPQDHPAKSTTTSRGPGRDHPAKSTTTSRGPGQTREGSNI